MRIHGQERHLVHGDVQKKRRVCRVDLTDRPREVDKGFEAGRMS